MTGKALAIAGPVVDIGDSITSSKKEPVMIDYFLPPATEEEEVVRRIKGNFRRQFVQHAIEEEGLDSVPPAWKQHDVSETLKGFLQQQHPQARGGEDLPDLEEGEVEIARLTYTDNVHGEVTSLRARRAGDGGAIRLRIVDEYGTEIGLSKSEVLQPLTDKEVLAVFQEADPSPLDTECQVEFTSDFYPDLNRIHSDDL